LQQTEVLLQDIGVTPKTVVVDLGFRGVDETVPDVQLLHRGKSRSMTAQQWRWVKRRQAVEPVIGHAKLDHRMDRCWLPGATGDALHAVLCAAGYNIRWLLRAIQRKGVKALFLALRELWRALSHGGTSALLGCAGLVGRGLIASTQARRPSADAVVVLT
jgi:IS5 family transposase